MISAFQKISVGLFQLAITKRKTKIQTSSFKKFWLKQLIFPLYIWPRVTLSGNLSTLDCDRKFQQQSTKEDEALEESASGENLPRATSSSSLGFLLMGEPGCCHSHAPSPGCCHVTDGAISKKVLIAFSPWQAHRGLGEKVRQGANQIISVLNTQSSALPGDMCTLFSSLSFTISITCFLCSAPQNCPSQY